MTYGSIQASLPDWSTWQYPLLRVKLQGPYSQQFIFFEAYEWAQLVRALYYTSLEKLAIDKHSSLLGPLVSYEETKVW